MFVSESLNDFKELKICDQVIKKSCFQQFIAHMQLFLKESSIKTYP